MFYLLQYIEEFLLFVFHGHLCLSRLLSDNRSACSVRGTADVGPIPGSEDPLEEELAVHSSILAWGSPVDRGAWRPQPTGSQRVGHG